MLSTASALLRDAGYHLLERYLKLATFQIASYKILRRRLFYERNGWDNKFAHVQGMIEHAAGWYSAIDYEVGGILSAVDHFKTQPISTVGHLPPWVREFTAYIRNVIRVVGQESAYIDNIAQQYLLQVEVWRPEIHARYISHLLVRVRALGASVRNLASLIDCRQADPKSGERALWTEVIEVKAWRDMNPLLSEPTPAAMQVFLPAFDPMGWENMRQDLGEIDVRRPTLYALGAKLRDLEVLLDPVYVDDPPPNVASDPLNIKRSQAQAEIVEIGPAARREMKNLGRGGADVAVRRIVERWVTILQHHPDVADPILGVRRDRRMANADVRRADMCTEVRSMLQNESFVQRIRVANRAVGIPEIADPTTADLRRAIGEKAGSGADGAGDRAWLLDYWTVNRVDWIVNRGDDIEFDHYIRSVVQHAENAIGMWSMFGI